MDEDVNRWRNKVSVSMQIYSLSCLSWEFMSHTHPESCNPSKSICCCSAPSLPVCPISEFPPQRSYNKTSCTTRINLKSAISWTQFVFILKDICPKKSSRNLITGTAKNNYDNVFTVCAHENSKEANTKRKGKKHYKWKRTSNQAGN